MKWLLFFPLLLSLSAFANDDFDVDGLNEDDKDLTSRAQLERESNEGQMSATAFKDWLQEYFNRPISERYDLDFRVQGRIRHEDKDSGDVTRAQPRFEVQAHVDITPDGCLKAHAKAGTGGQFDTGWDDLETSTRDENLNFDIRTLYFDYELCDIANAHIEVGAMPVNSPGLLGPKNTGWTDGVRIRYTTPDGRTKWVVSIGDVDEFDEANLFQRDFDGVNFKQASVTHDLNEKLQIMTDVIEHADNVYVRAGATVKLNHVTGLLDELYIENSWVEGKQQGAILRLKKSVGRWTFEPSISHLEDFQGNGEMIPVESFYGSGSDGESRTNGQFKVSFKKGKNCAYVARARAGQSPTRAEIGFVCKF